MTGVQKFNHRLDTGDLAGRRTERGHNMTTASGLPFWPGLPSIADIRIEDIAAHLSRLCRFNGALRDDVEIYSVAQHSVLVSHNVPPPYQLEGLLHDAAEAYVGDRVKPLKLMTPEFEVWEKRIDVLVRQKYGLPATCSQMVKDADYRAVLTERRDVLPLNLQVDWGVPLASPWPAPIAPWLPSAARAVFLQRFHQLTGEF